jgi:hypothetical protein
MDLSGKGVAMKTIVFLTSIAGTVLIEGCASAPLTDAYLDGLIICNKQAMEKVERIAKRSLKEVRWVNCPTETIKVVKPTAVELAQG